MFNGRHPDGYTPLTLTRWAEFLDFFVARKIPRLNPAIRLFQEELLASIFGARGLRFEEDRFAQYQDYESALAAFKAEPEVRVLFESGYGSAVTEAPVARFERTFSAWPPPATASRWYLGPEETLTTFAPRPLTAGDDGVDAYRHDPEAGTKSTIVEDDLYHILWSWEPAVTGYAVSYLADPFAVDTLVVGNGGYVHLWFASDATDANVEVSILEVRPDGVEFLVQTGVFAVKHRRGVDVERSQEFLREYTYAATAVSYLTPGEFVEVDVPIQPFSHAFRAGTRLRLVIDTPGRDHGYWEFVNPSYGEDVIHRIARDPSRPSYLVLPTMTGTDIPDDAPPCYSLRGIICRAFLPLPNTAVTD
jgi:predicted acyl esterase